MKIWKYTDSKKGPRFTEVNAEDQYKSGWVNGSECKEFLTVLYKEYKELVYSHWDNLTDDQRNAIYNHKIRYTTNTAGNRTTKDTRYIFFELRGAFEIRYSDEYGTFVLSIYSRSGDKYHIVTAPGNLSREKCVRWLKCYAQYLIDEPEDLNAIICTQIPLPVYVNPALYMTAYEPEGVPV